MDGRIDVDSNPGRTTFSLVLPLHLPANEPGLGAREWSLWRVQLDDQSALSRVWRQREMEAMR